MKSINQTDNQVEEIVDQTDQTPNKKGSRLGLRHVAQGAGATFTTTAPIWAHFVFESFGVPHGTAERLGIAIAALSPAFFAREIMRSASLAAHGVRNRVNLVLNRGD